MSVASMTFKQKLEHGQVGESALSGWLQRRGFNVLPVYEVMENKFKGPRLFSAGLGELVAPDILAFKDKQTLWIDAKRKSAFSFHRNTERWVTGIDIAVYEDYLRIASLAPWPVWLMFVQEGGQAKGDACTSPSGLYGERLDVLAVKENHRFSGYGRGGMVYWAIESLRYLAALEELGL